LAFQSSSCDISDERVIVRHGRPGKGFPSSRVTIRKTDEDGDHSLSNFGAGISGEDAGEDGEHVAHT
jgi:hypothetical protein